MARGSKAAYTEKQKREAEHIAEGYTKRGVSATEAKRRAWATVNAMTGGGKKSGSGRGKAMNLAPAKKGGRKGGGVYYTRSELVRHLVREAVVPAFETHLEAVRIEAATDPARAAKQRSIHLRNPSPSPAH